MNMSDSERVISVLDKAGYEWTDNEDEAGLIGILACSVRQKAIDKVYSRIHKWNKWKNNKNLRIGAIVLFSITLIKLFFYDISHLDTLSKTIVFVSLGILLLIISFLYNKFKDIIFDEN